MVEIMKINNQTYGRCKTQKLFDTCKIEGRWKRADNSVPRKYIATEDGASIELSIMDGDYTESFRFKKNSTIIIKDSITEFYERDLLR